MALCHSYEKPLTKCYGDHAKGRSFGKNLHNFGHCPKRGGGASGPCPKFLGVKFEIKSGILKINIRNQQELPPLTTEGK